MEDTRKEILKNKAIGVINEDGTYDFFTPEEYLDLKIKQSRDLKKVKQREYSNREDVRKKRKMYNENNDNKEMRKLYLDDDETRRRSKRRAKIRRVQNKVLNDFSNVFGITKIIEKNLECVENGEEPTHEEKEEMIDIINNLINIDPEIIANDIVKAVNKTWNE